MNSAPGLSRRTIRRQIPVVLGLLLAFGGLRAAAAPEKRVPKGRLAEGIRIEGPFAHENLAIYVVRGTTTDPLLPDAGGGTRFEYVDRAPGAPESLPIHKSYVGKD